MMRRTLLASLIAATGLVGLAARADAHADFVGVPTSLAPDSDVSLVMSVPHERDDATYNTGVAVQLPAGWRMVSCQSKETWTCASSSDAGRAVVRFTKADGAGPAEDETFRFVLHTGTEDGTFPLPTVQTYNTGEVVRWIEGASGAEPAPSLTVSGSAPATTAAPADTTVAPAPPATTEPPATSAAPASTAAPETTVAPTTAASTTAVATTSAASTTTAVATTTSAAPTTTAAATTTIAVIAPAPTSSTGDDGSNTGVIVLVVVLAGAGAAAGFYLAKRRPKPAA